MPTISSALNSALAGLSVNAAQSALVARNVTSAGDENYTRRTAQVQLLTGGAPMVSAIGRSTDRQLMDKVLLASSDAAGKRVILDTLTRMSGLTGDPQDEQSIASALARLQNRLRAYEGNPTNGILARDALEAARSVTTKLNAASTEVATLRGEADRSLADTVEQINGLLAQFKIVNDVVARGQGTMTELADSLDQRDAILKNLAELVGIRTSVRSNNEVVIFAESGAVLFETKPRALSFSATAPLLDGMTGGAVLIDGVPVTGEGAAMPITSGRLGALAMMRDQTAPQLARQLDQIAAGLIQGFAEREQAIPSTLPDVQGLFVTSDGSLPLLDAPAPGLARQISVNALADPAAGGSMDLLRDGGFGGPPYVHNALGQPGYQKRIAELADALDAAQNFGTLAEIGGSVSLKSFSADSAGWVEATRQAAHASYDTAAATRARAGESLTRVTGVNIDQEMAALLDLEKSYQASSKVLATVNAMLAMLMEAIR
jgi:flagellar hook-associated protein 1 FlgK